MSKIWRGQFDGNPFLGLFARASDKAVLIPRGAGEKFEFGAKSLGVPIVRATVDGSPFLGLFIAMNSNGIVVPKLAEKEELATFKSLGLNVHVMAHGEFSAAGNNIACNDRAALVNPDMPHHEIKKIADCLGVEAHAGALAGYKTPGMACVVTNKGWLAHNRISAEEAQMLESLFKQKGINGTVNSGTALVGCALSANSNGAMVGESCSGFELGRIEQALDLV